MVTEMVLMVFSNPFVVWINILRRTVGVSQKKKNRTCVRAADFVRHGCMRAHVLS